MKKPIKITVTVIGIAVLIATGVTGTLFVQKTVSNIEAQGVRKYKDTCTMYQNNEKTQKWLECDVR